MNFWTLIIVVVILFVTTNLHYEVGYENGLRGCYNCGMLSEPWFPRVWEPWFDFSEEVT